MITHVLWLLPVIAATLILMAITLVASDVAECQLPAVPQVPGVVPLVLSMLLLPRQTLKMTLGMITQKLMMTNSQFPKMFLKRWNVRGLKQKGVFFGTRMPSLGISRADHHRKASINSPRTSLGF